MYVYMCIEKDGWGMWLKESDSSHLLDIHKIHFYTASSHNTSTSCKTVKEIIDITSTLSCLK